MSLRRNFPPIFLTYRHVLLSAVCCRDDKKFKTSEKAAPGKLAPFPQNLDLANGAFAIFFLSDLASQRLPTLLNLHFQITNVPFQSIVSVCACQAGLVRSWWYRQLASTRHAMSLKFYSTKRLTRTSQKACSTPDAGTTKRTRFV